MENKNLISLSGRIGSGKDLTGKIFQVLLDKPKAFDKLSEVTEKDVDYAVFDQPTFQIKKFAAKLKDIVCILLDCTRDELEDRKFKEKELGEEWWVYKVHDGSVFRVVTKDYYNSTDRHKIILKLTPRKILQLLGTEAGREIIHPNIWVNSLMGQYKPKGGLLMSNTNMGVRFYHEDGSHTDTGSIPAPKFDKDTIVFPKWIITDTRFPNEFEAVKSRGGICIKVERKKNDIEGHLDCSETEDGYCIKEENNYCPGSCEKEHISETALNKYEFDYVINNDGTIKDLIEKVKEVIKKFNIKK